MIGPVHAARANYFETDTTWRLMPEALTCERDGYVASYRYAEISQLRLSFDPTRVDTARYRCDVTAGRRSATIRSSHFAGIADFEDRAATYTPLVRELIARVAAANPRCTFRAGKAPLVYWAEHLFLLAMAALLVTVLLMVSGYEMSELVWLKLTIVIGFVPLLFVYARKNLPRTFKPDAVPSDLLPSAGP